MSLLFQIFQAIAGIFLKISLKNKKKIYIQNFPLISFCGEFRVEQLIESQQWALLSKFVIELFFTNRLIEREISN